MSRALVYIVHVPLFANAAGKQHTVRVSLSSPRRGQGKSPLGTQCFGCVRQCVLACPPSPHPRKRSLLTPTNMDSLADNHARTLIPSTPTIATTAIGTHPPFSPVPPPPPPPLSIPRHILPGHGSQHSITIYRCDSPIIGDNREKWGTKNTKEKRHDRNTSRFFLRHGISQHEKKRGAKERGNSFVCCWHA